MMKKIFAVLVGIILLCGTALLVSCKSESESPFILEENETGYTLVGVNDKNISDAVIPEGVTVIGDKAFYQCRKLRSVELPGGLTAIGSQAFDECERLENVIIPDSVTTVGNSAFSNCGSLFAVDIGSGVTHIGDTAFTFSGLVRVIGGENVTSIGSAAFQSCSRLVSISIGGSVTEVGYSAFLGCNNLLEVIVPSEDWIGNDNYYKESGLEDYKEYFHTGESRIVEADGFWFYTHGEVNYLISCVEDVVTLRLPESYKGEDYRVHPFAFYGREKIVSVTIPVAVTEIGDSAFGNCYKLLEVVNNSSFSIGKGFDGNGGVGKYAILVTSGESRFVDSDGYLLYEYAGKRYLVGYDGEDTELHLPENLNGKQYDIYSRAFMYYDSITSVTLSSGVNDIGEMAFYGCESLRAVSFSDSIKDIGEAAFAYCRALTEIVIPDNVKSISDGAFEGCSSMKSVTLSEGMTAIGAELFRNCHALKNVSIPSKIKTIGTSAFEGCEKLTQITIPGSVEKINSQAFKDCTLLSKVVFENVDGWYSGSHERSFTADELSDSQKAAKLLTEQYVSWSWSRG